jgi:hypothetical protein
VKAVANSLKDLGMEGIQVIIRMFYELGLVWWEQDTNLTSLYLHTMVQLMEALLVPKCPLTFYSSSS